MQRVDAWQLLEEMNKLERETVRLLHVEEGYLTTKDKLTATIVQSESWQVRIPMSVYHSITPMYHSITPLHCAEQIFA